MIGPDGYDFRAHIHTFKWQDLNICLDVNSGAVHLLDDLALRLVELIAEHGGNEEEACAQCRCEASAEDVRAALVEIMEAVHQEALFTTPEEIKIDYSSYPLKALCLNVAHRCNMNCRYCFAGQGDFGLNEGLMSLSIGQKAIEYLLTRSGSVQKVEIDFFGGEPLLNWNVVKSLVGFGREKAEQVGKQIHYTLTTNGLLLSPEVNGFILDQGISVVLSLDGRPKNHNYHRPLKNGKDSYALVLPKIQALVEASPVSYYIRGTFTAHNLDFSQDVRHLAELGFKHISLEPAVGTSQIREEDLSVVLAEYEKLAELLWTYRQGGKEINYFHFNLDLQKGPCLAKRITGCGAGVEYLAVTPEGDLYPCHQLVGKEQFWMGNVQAGNIDSSIQADFARSHLNSKEECRRCWARFFCGGGCHANNFLSLGTLKKPNPVTCGMHRKRIEAGISLEIRKALPEMGI